MASVLGLLGLIVLVLLVGALAWWVVNRPDR